MTDNGNVPTGFQFFGIEKPTLLHIDFKHCIVSMLPPTNLHLPDAVAVAFDIHVPLARENCHTILMVQVCSGGIYIHCKMRWPLPEIPPPVFSIIIGRERPFLNVNHACSQKVKTVFDVFFQVNRRE